MHHDNQILIFIKVSSKNVNEKSTYEKYRQIY